MALIEAAWHDYGDNESTYAVWFGIVLILASLGGFAESLRREIRSDVEELIDEWRNSQ